MTRRVSTRTDSFAASLRRGTLYSLLCLIGLAVFGFSLPLGATTPKPMTLTEVKYASASIVLGKVTDLQVKVIGSSQNTRYGDHKQSTAPATDEDHSFGTMPGNQDSTHDSPLGYHNHDFHPTIDKEVDSYITEDQMPQSLGTEGGMMLFTKISMAPESVLGSRDGIESDGQIRFMAAGGALDDFEVVVHGMPELQAGGRYIVFLYRELQNRGDPYVGLGQGVFPVVFDPQTGRDMVTNLSGSPVVGIENGQVIVRASDEDRSEFEAMRSPPPTPLNKNDVIRSSVEESRFWSSKETVLDPYEFMKLVEGL